MLNFFLAPFRFLGATGTRLRLPRESSQFHRCGVCISGNPPPNWQSVRCQPWDLSKSDWYVDTLLLILLSLLHTSCWNLQLLHGLLLRQPSLASASIRAGSRGYSRTRFGNIYAEKHRSNPWTKKLTLWYSYRSNGKMISIPIGTVDTIDDVNSPYIEGYWVHMFLGSSFFLSMSVI